MMYSGVLLAMPVLRSCEEMNTSSHISWAYLLWLESATLTSIFILVVLSRLIHKDPNGKTNRDCQLQLLSGRNSVWRCLHTGEFPIFGRVLRLLNSDSGTNMKCAIHLSHKVKPKQSKKQDLHFDSQFSEQSQTVLIESSFWLNGNYSDYSELFDKFAGRVWHCLGILFRNLTNCVGLRN